MVKNLNDVDIYDIMEDDKLQEVLDRINKGESFNSTEVQELLRQILYWRSAYSTESELLNRTRELREKYKKEVADLKNRFKKETIR